MYTIPGTPTAYSFGLDVTIYSRKGEVKQADQKNHHDIHAKPRHFEPGQYVMVRDKRPTALTAWIPGVVIQQKGPLTYIVKVCDGKLWKRHIDHLRLSSPAPDMQEDSTPYSSAPTVLPAALLASSTLS